jgi:hypothetical protein
VTAPAPDSAVQIVKGYPDPEEVAALIAVLTAVTRAGSAAPGPEQPERPGRTPAGAPAGRYLSPTSWQAP